MSSSYRPSQGRPPPEHGRDRPASNYSRYDDDYARYDTYRRDDDYERERYRDDPYDERDHHNGSRRYQGRDRRDDPVRYDNSRASYGRGYEQDSRHIHPLPRRPDSSATDVYSFRGAAARDDRRSQDEFTFRAPVPTGPRQGPRFPSPEPRQWPEARNRPQHNRGGRGRGRGRSRGPFHASDRDIMRQTYRGSTPEQLTGMNENGHARFASVSSSDDDGSEDGEVIDVGQESDGGDVQRSRKRAKIDASPKADDVGSVESDAAPKWSNPDPHVDLPPLEQSRAHKKDIVQFIRKAKVEAAPKSSDTNAVSDNVDFISFGGEGDDHEDDMSDTSHPTSEYAPPNDPIALPNNRDHRAPLHGRLRPNTADGNSVASFYSDATLDSESSTALPHHRGERRHARDPVGPPPQPPPGLVMPTDEELMANYVGDMNRKRKRNDISIDVGGIIKEWRYNGIDSTPWCTEDHTRAADPGLRLHEEICEFFEFVRPHAFEDTLRRDLVNRVQAAIRRFKPAAANVEVKSFGSFAAGIYLPTADMDLVALSPNFLNGYYPEFCQSRNQLRALGDYLQSSGIVAPGSLSVVPKAKVPIIKYVDSRTGIKVDISFENMTGVVAVDTFERWKEEYPAMPILVVLIKQLLAMRNLNEVHTGGIGGFTTICLVVSMLQLMPEMQSRSMADHDHYGDLLLNFLDLYGNKFNFQDTGIKLQPPGYYDKIRNPMPKQNNRRLTIIDPNNSQNDISGGSNRVGDVFHLFKRVHASLHRRLHQIRTGEIIEGSVLGPCWAGNYSIFTEQRRRLDELSRAQPGHIPPPPGNLFRQPPPIHVVPQPPPPAAPAHLPPRPPASTSRSGINRHPPPAASHGDRRPPPPPARPAPTRKKDRSNKKSKSSNSDHLDDDGGGGKSKKAKKKGKKSKGISMKQRAETYRKDYPGMEVPEKLGKKQARDLKATWKSQQK